MSMVISGLLVAAIGFILQHAGHTVDHEQVQNFVAMAFQIGGAIIAYVGRVRHGDITWFGTKK